jgi:hypothetical protein
VLQLEAVPLPAGQKDVALKAIHGITPWFQWIISIWARSDDLHFIDEEAVIGEQTRSDVKDVRACRMCLELSRLAREKKV